MSFRDFINNFRFRRKLEAEFDRFQNMKPPAKPSRRYIDKLVRRLLDEHTAWFARRELEMIGAAAIPSLVAAFNDVRFYQADRWSEDSWMPAPFQAVLGLIDDHAPDEVVRIAFPLVHSPSATVRDEALGFVASAGRAIAIPALREVFAGPSQDRDNYLRSRIAAGVRHAATKGRADATFRSEAYELFLSEADKDWGVATNESARTLIALDASRAMKDLTSDRLLSRDNPNIVKLIKACNEAGILLPEGKLRRLLESELAKEVDAMRYPDSYVAAGSLRALAIIKANGVDAIAKSLLNHGNDEIKEAAADALAILAGIGDPTMFVIDRATCAGYSALSLEQRVVRCAHSFEAEVCNGGLLQFFGNSSGDHVVDTLEALSILGQKEALEALQGAIRLVGPMAKEPDRDLRLTAFEGRFDELRAAFEPLERAYYARTVEFRQAFLLYAVNHPDHFRP